MSSHWCMTAYNMGGNANIVCITELQNKDTFSRTYSCYNMGVCCIHFLSNCINPAKSLYFSLLPLPFFCYLCLSVTALTSTCIIGHFNYKSYEHFYPNTFELIVVNGLIMWFTAIVCIRIVAYQQSRIEGSLLMKSAWIFAVNNLWFAENVLNDWSYF
jgi:hypothetical protein